MPINDHHVNLVAMVTNEPVSTVDEAFAVLRPVQGSEVRAWVVCLFLFVCLLLIIVFYCCLSVHITVLQVTGGSASSELDRLIASKVDG